jgi:2-aminobenzoate-CoA ligase
MLGPSAHVDTFPRDNLPPPEQWPRFNLEGFVYPDYVNAAVELTDRMVERGFGDRVALIGHGRRRTYRELSDWTNRLARSSSLTALSPATGCWSVRPTIPQ